MVSTVKDRRLTVQMIAIIVNIDKKTISLNFAQLFQYDNSPRKNRAQENNC